MPFLNARKVTKEFLPYTRHSIEKDDVSAVVATLESDFLTTGPIVERYEAAFATATAARNAVACNSGTAALHLAALGLNLKVGEAAVVPAMTFLATANVVRMTQAEVVFADVDPDTGLLSPETLADALTRHSGAQRIRVGFPVHLNGRLCDMAGLAAIADKHGLKLIEDACHALGVDGIGTARYSKAACFSTHPAKAIATGEGGMVATQDADMGAHMRRLRNHGMSRESAGFLNLDLALEDGATNPWYFEMSEIGWNYRLPDILCALGLSQLKKLSRFMARRRQIAALYESLLAPLSPVIRPVSHVRSPHGWHLYAVLVDYATLGITRSRFMAALHKAGIGSQVHYIPLHWQPYYRQRYGHIALAGAEAYYSRCLSIPFFPGMTDDDVHRVVATISKFVQQ